MPYKNDQWVTNEVSIFVVCLMSGIHINNCEILDVQMRRKALKGNLSMVFSMLICKLCAQASVYYFYMDVASPVVGMFELG